MNINELREGERWEWGVCHSHGTRVDGDETAARRSLTWMLGKKLHPDEMAPHLVRRRVGGWELVEEGAA